MDSLLTTHRKFTWSSFILCSSFTLFLFAVIFLGAAVLTHSGSISRSVQLSHFRSELEQWNETLPRLTGWKVVVEAEGGGVVELKEDDSGEGKIKGVKMPKYQHLKYSANQTVWTSTALLHPSLYNFTSALTLSYTVPSANTTVSQSFPATSVLQRTIAPHSQESTRYPACTLRGEGVWTEEGCVEYLYLAAVCFVVNVTTLKGEWDTCPASIEVWRVYPWTAPTPPTSLSFYTSFCLRSSLDPFYLAQKSAFSQSFSPETLIVGCILILIGGLFLLIPLVYFYQVCRKTERLLLKADMEMSSMREAYAPRI